MNAIERSSHPSRAQLETLLDYLEQNPKLAKGFSKIPSLREAARRHWEKLAVRLNCIGGSVKSWKQWTKYWADKKSAVKKKAAVRAAAQRNGRDIEDVVELSDLEERILTIMGFKSCATGDSQLRLRLLKCEPPEEPAPTTQDSDDQSFSNLTERFVRVEEQRLEIDRKNTQILETMSGIVGQLLERDSEREHATAQALLAVGEGLKLLAEAVKK